MCKSTNELDLTIAEIRSLKALKAETENAIKALEFNAIGFMTEKQLTEFIGTDYKVTYKEQSRTTLDKERLTADLGDLSDYEKVTTYPVLRIA